MDSKEKAGAKKSVKNRKHDGIKSCKIYSDIHNWLVSGIPVEKVADMIREQGHLTKMKKESLVLALKRYLKDVPPGEIAAKHIPLIAIRAMEKLEPVVDTIKHMQGTIKFYVKRVEKKWNMVARTEAKLEKIIDDEKNPEYAASLLQNLFKLSEGVEADTIKIVHLYKLIIEMQVEAGILQRNLGTLDVNVVKYEASIREIAKTSNMKVENIEALLKNPQSMYKVMDFVKALRKADPKIIERFMKEDRKALEEAKHKK